MVQAAVGCDHCQSIRSDNLHCSEGGRPKKQRSNVLAPYWGLSLFTCSGTSWPHKFQLHHAIWNMSHFMARRTFRKFAMHYSCLENKLAGMWALPKTVFWTSFFFLRRVTMWLWNTAVKRTSSDILQQDELFRVKSETTPQDKSRTFCSRVCRWNPNCLHLTDFVSCRQSLSDPFVLPQVESSNAEASTRYAPLFFGSTEATQVASAGGPSGAGAVLRYGNQGGLGSVPYQDSIQTCPNNLNEKIMQVGLTFRVNHKYIKTCCALPGLHYPLQEPLCCPFLPGAAKCQRSARCFASGWVMLSLGKILPIERRKCAEDLSSKAYYSFFGSFGHSVHFHGHWRVYPFRSDS